MCVCVCVVCVRARARVCVLTQGTIMSSSKRYNSQLFFTFRLAKLTEMLNELSECNR